MYKSLLPLLVLFFICCKENKDSKPPISPEEMAAILTDLYYMEANFESLSGYVKDSLTQTLKQEILNKHQTNDSIFLLAGDYYNLRPEMLENIERMVIDKIESQSKPDSSTIRN